MEFPIQDPNELLQKLEENNFSEKETESIWDILMTNQRIELLQKSNESLEIAEDNLLPYAILDWHEIQDLQINEETTTYQIAGEDVANPADVAETIQASCKDYCTDNDIEIPESDN